MTGTTASSSIAYLSEPVATWGAGPLFDQKARIDALASDLGLRIERYVVDAGRGDDPSQIASNLAALLEASADLRGKTILVDGVSRFDHRQAVVRAIVQRFERDGSSVISTADAGGAITDRGDFAIQSASRSIAFERAPAKRRERAAAP